MVQVATTKGPTVEKRDEERDKRKQILSALDREPWLGKESPLG